ncbi:MAG: NAD-dependent epimerase/dehydratase family protein, partial [Anaerolineales bacterium]|nr:NAD-dependent epimerase/dehydratase family protein [Anaerolineales bacterium]
EVNVLDFQERRFGPMPANIHFVRGDLSQAYLVREALTGVDVVFHLAWATIHETSNEDPSADVTINLIPAIHLFEMCRQMGVKKVVFTSSGGTVYGPANTIPIPESHPKNPINGYGVTKLAVEKYLQMFHHLHGLDFAILRPSVPYGPLQNPLGRQGAAAVFLYRISQGLPLTIWGDGSVTRDYFYVTDLVEALMRAANLPLTQARIFNIGGAEELSLLQLIQHSEKIVGKKAQVEFLPARKFDAERIVLDTTLAHQNLQWTPKIGFEEGLAKTWKWMSATFNL